MIEFPPTRYRLNMVVALAAATFPFFFASCSSTSKIKGLPTNLPDIALTGSSATPPHRMASYEYPFDSGGNYVSEWAAEGERRSGRPASATESDEKKWSGSHGKSSSSTKGKSKSTASKTTSKSTPSKSSGTKRHTVKSSDNLYSIARKYGTTVAKLKKANGLKSDKIRNGAVLIIPK